MIATGSVATLFYYNTFIMHNKAAREGRKNIMDRVTFCYTTLIYKIKNNHIL